jgi:hypothetical protein
MYSVPRYLNESELEKPAESRGRRLTRTRLIASTIRLVSLAMLGVIIALTSILLVKSSRFDKLFEFQYNGVDSSGIFYASCTHLANTKIKTDFDASTVTVADLSCFGVLTFIKDQCNNHQDCRLDLNWYLKEEFEVMLKFLLY